MIRSPDNDRLKTIRKLAQKRWREKLGLFAAEGEDLVAAAEQAGWEPRFVLRSGVDVEPELLAAVSTLGSGTRVIGVYEQRWSEPGGDLSVWLHGVEDPGNVGTILRSAHALADGPVILGPGCADPYSPKAVRASMGSLFARPPARAQLAELPGRPVALSAHGERSLRDARLEPPLVLCLGAERGGLPAELEQDALRIPVSAESLNVAMAATVALYEAAHRITAHG
ncbi:MAG: methyltransferase, TrmH family [Thermoleophilaceae bacterium]|jgi:TrmH family RNA methyltransferase|nr:methyltransferase, TrmH family [Thermoleophilaceae bacterium]